jgi:O-antigen/teichoic acid export membrane protein
LGKIVNKFSKNEFLRNVSILTSGTVFAQLVMVLALPVLTRLYSPQDFDLLAVYAALINIASVGACLRFNIAIPLPKRDSDAMALLYLASIAAFIFSALLGLVVLIFPTEIASLLNQPSLQAYFWMLPAGVLFASLYDAAQFWASRKKRFGLITHTRIVRSIFGASTQLGYGATLVSPFGLLFGHMLYSGFGFVSLWRSIWRDDIKVLRNISLTRLRSVGSSYRGYPYKSVPEAIFNTMSVELPVVLIAASALGPEAGFLMLASRVIGMPMAFIGSSVGQVYLAEAPEHKRQGSLGEFTLTTMSRLLLVGMPPLVMFGLLAPFLFPIVFGAEWGRAGIILAWLTPSFVLQFIASPVSMVLHVIENVTLAMWLQLIGVIIRVGSVTLGLFFYPSLVTEIFAISGVFFYALFIVIILSQLKILERH